MIHTLKIFSNVAFEYVFVAACEGAVAIDRRMGALTPAAGVGVKNKGAVEYRFDDVAQRMVHHPVAVGGGADQPPFGIVNPEVTISAVAVGLGMQLLLSRSSSASRLRLNLAVARLNRLPRCALRAARSRFWKETICG